MVIVKQVCCDVRDFSGSFPQELTTTLSLKTCSGVPKFFFHRILTIQDKNHRHRTACSKTRAEVRGGGRKPWKQKGTGKARAGSSTSPLWKGGGVIFGPKPVVYKKKINTKERYLAISTGLYVSSSKIVVIRNLVPNIEQFRTKVFLRFLGDLGASLLSKKVLIVACKITRELYLSCRNIKNVALVSGRTLTLRHILLADTILIIEEALSEFMDHSVNDINDFANA